MKKLLARIQKLLRDRRTRRLFTRTVSLTAAIVVFVTTYALVLPAITMETEADCGIEAHQHDKSCYEEQLICDLEESEDHHHSSSCYKNVLTCGKEVHTHSEACYHSERAEADPEEAADSSDYDILMTNADKCNLETILERRFNITPKKGIHNLLSKDKKIFTEGALSVFPFKTRANLKIQEGWADPFAVVQCDVNGLKYINDTKGHKAGDDYIRSASHLICELFQHSPVYRTGGDEFVVYLSGRDFMNRDEILGELNHRAEAHIYSGEVVVSAGMSEFHSGEDHSFHSVFERADKRMYERKQLLKSMGARTRD